MKTSRLEAFSDGVLAIIITIMVLELKIPEGNTMESLKPVLPTFTTYILSFVYLGIYWNNHHHLMHASDVVNGKVLWANLHLLFWLSPANFTGLPQVLLHYFLLTSLMWMCTEAINMYQALIKVFTTYSSYFILKRCIVAWGMWKD